MNKTVVLAVVAILAAILPVTSLAQTQQAQPAGQTSISPSEKVPPATESRPERANPEEFVIGTGDILAINVWKEAEISRVVPVRSDGRISLPLVGELMAGGRTARQLEAEIRTKLKDFISNPEVTVVVQEIRSQKFNVLGMVNHPGSFPLTKPMTVVDAIAVAGGFRDFAKQKDIYVLRRDSAGKQTRLAFNYKDVIKGLHPEQNIELQSDDTVVVP
jgi:polysaccharide export outer membrane protein